MRCAAAGNGVEFAAFAGGFLGARSAHGAQVVSGFEATFPCELVEFVELFARRAGHVNVERLRLVNPLLAARCSFNEPRRIHLECGGVVGFQVGGNAVDLRQCTVEILEVRNHHVIPQAARFEIDHEVFVDDRELAREVRLDEQVFVVRFDASRHADDVGDRCGRRDRDAV